MSPLLIGIAAFFGVAALVGGLFMFLSEKPASRLEDRLQLLTSTSATSAAKDALKEGSLLARPLDDGEGLFDGLFARFGNMSRLFEQADTNLTVARLVGISALFALVGGGGALALRVHMAIAPVIAVLLAMLPLGWLFFRRKRRMKAFASQLPDALEMLSRGLRAGQSLPFGFNMVSTEMAAPIGKEFGRVFEEQNLGIPFEDSLNGMTERVPNLDLKFFTTAVILQRQTGGDLAEILDKIGNLIRERFRIWGQVQALTGEGRLSGIVLLALPFGLFLAAYQLNPQYIMTLFTDPMGKKMLAGAIVMQVLGALVIRKIVNIKV